MCFRAGRSTNLLREAAHDAVAREHVSGYFKLHPGFARLVQARRPMRALPMTGRASPSIRRTISPSSKRCMSACRPRPARLRWPIFCCCWSANRGLKAMNAHVRQKTLQAQGGLGADPLRRRRRARLRPRQTLAESGAGALRDREGFRGVFRAERRCRNGGEHPRRRFRDRAAARGRSGPCAGRPLSRCAGRIC